MSSRRLTNVLFALLVLALSVRASGGAAEKPAESRAALVYVEPWVAGDDAVKSAELHAIASELFKNALVASKKFAFAPDAAAPGVEMSLRGILRTGYTVELSAQRPDGTLEPIAVAPSASLEKLVEDAARAVSGMQKRTGFVIKREGARIVIARGSEEGITVGQKYRTTDTFEDFVIQSVNAHTAEGLITGGGGPRSALGAEVAAGAVDVVFLIDTTASMQEEIDGVLANCQRFASNLAAKKIDARLGLVNFRVGIVSTVEPTADIEAFKAAVAPLRAGGGGDETPFLAMQGALAMRFRPGAKRIFVLITDEQAFDAVESAGYTVSFARREMPAGCATTGRVQPDDVLAGPLGKSVMDPIKAAGVAVFAVALDDYEGVYRALAAKTGGAYYDLEKSQDFTTLLDTMGERIEGMFMEL